MFISGAESACESKLICGSDGVIYESTCDFDRAVNNNPNLTPTLLDACTTNFDDLKRRPLAILDIVSKDINTDLSLSSAKFPHRQQGSKVPGINRDKIIKTQIIYDKYNE